MNPLVMLAVYFVLSNQGNSLGYRKPLQIGKLGIPPIGPSYFDTFKMELLVDRLHTMTDTLEKVNHLNQMRNIPFTRNNSLDRVQESVEAVRGLLAEQKAAKKLDKLSTTISGVKRLGDMQGLMSTMGPMLTMLTNQNDNGTENK